MKRFLLQIALLLSPLSLAAQLRLLPFTPHAPGDTVTITWEGAEPGVPVRVEYRTGESWKLIAESAEGGSVRWTMPSALISPTIRISAVRQHRPVVDLKHPGSIKRFVLNSDASRCITFCTDSTMRLWDVWSGTVLHAWHAEEYSWLSSPELINDRYCLTTTYTRDSLWRKHYSVQLRNAEDATTILSVEDVYDYGAEFNSSGTRLLTALYGRKARLWDVETGALIRSLDNVNSTRFCHGGEWLLVESDQIRIDSYNYAGGYTSIWDAESGQLLQRYPGKLYRTDDPNAPYWVVEDSTRRTVIDTLTGRAIGSLSRRLGPPLFSRDGAHALTADDEGTLLWDLRTMHSIAHLEGEADYTGLLPFSPDGTRVLTRIDYGHFKLWDAGTGRFIATLRCNWNERLIRRYCDNDCMSHLEDRVSFNDDGSRILIAPSCNGNGRMDPILWDGHTGRRIAALHGRDYPHFCAGGESVETSVYYDRYMREVVFSAATGRRMFAFNYDPYGEQPDMENRQSLRIRGNVLQKFDMRSGRATSLLKHRSPLAGYDTAAGRVITFDEDGVLRLWRGTDSLISTLTPDSDAGRAKFALDGKYIIGQRIALDTGTQRLSIWDGRTGQLLITDSIPHASERSIVLWQSTMSSDAKSIISSESRSDGHFLRVQKIADESRLFSDTAVIPLHPRLDESLESNEENASSPSSAPSPESRVAHSLLLHHPDPADERLIVRYHLSAEGTTHLALCDMKGNVVQVVVEGVERSGEHTVEIDASTLPAGSYLLTLHTGEEIITETVRVVR